MAKSISLPENSEFTRTFRNLSREEIADPDKLDVYESVGLGGRTDWDDLLGLIGAIPTQVRLRGAASLEILQFQIVTRPRLQRDGADQVGNAFGSPVGDDDLIVDPQDATVV